MMRLLTLLLSTLPLLQLTLSQSASDSGYTDYTLNIRDNEDTVIYETASTPANNATFGPPDVFLNASVHVGEINLLVANLTAQINLDVQVLNLLQFNAGVDLSIGRVNLNIRNVSAFVRLEARLENVVSMINTTLSSVDLNPVLATLGDAVGDLTGELGGALGSTTGSSSSSNTTGSTTNSSTTNTNSLTERSLDPFTLAENILYSVNDYSGNTHTNRIFAQNGDLVDQSLDNNGFVYNAQVVGNFASDMTFTGRERTGVVIDGQSTTEKEYAYIPFAGLEVVSHVYFGAGGDVVATRVFVEIEGGGTSTISDNED
jgi:hypothetical protein